MVDFLIKVDSQVQTLVGDALFDITAESVFSLCLVYSCCYQINGDALLLFIFSHENTPTDFCLSG